MTCAANPPAPCVPSCGACSKRSRNAASILLRRGPTGSRNGITTAHTVFCLRVFAVHAVRCMAARPAPDTGTSACRHDRAERCDDPAAAQSDKLVAAPPAAAPAGAPPQASRPGLGYGRNRRFSRRDQHGRRRSAAARVEAASGYRRDKRRTSFSSTSARITSMSRSRVCLGRSAQSSHAVFGAGDAIQARGGRRYARGAAGGAAGKRRQGDEGLSLPSRQLCDRRRIRDREPGPGRD